MPSLKCPHCQRILKVGESAAGKQITCPACKQKFRAPRHPGAGKAPPPPPPSGDGRPWHLHVDGRTTGPYSADAVREQLKAGKISRDTLAWREGMDDWKPVREIDELRKGARTQHPGASPGEEGEPERRRRFVPGKSKRDAIMGAWIAVGLAVVLIIVILTVANREDPNAVTDPYEYRLRNLRSATPVGPPPVSSTVIPAPGAGTAAPAKKPPKIIRKPKPKLSNEQLLTKAVKEIDAQFANCFANPGKADYKQLMVLQKKCTQYANDLKARDFGAYKRDVERYVHILEGTVGGVASQIKDISQKWYMGREGLPERAIAEQYPEDIAFLKNWQTAANEAKAKMRDRGLEF